MSFTIVPYRAIMFDYVESIMVAIYDELYIILVDRNLKELALATYAGVAEI